MIRKARPQDLQQIATLEAESRLEPWPYKGYERFSYYRNPSEDAILMSLQLKVA